MHKFMLKMFGFTKSYLQFCKIISMLVLVFLLLYWIQNLLGQTWGWIQPLAPFFNCLLYVGQCVSDGSIKLFNATFEYKYGIASLILIVVYVMCNIFQNFTDKVQNLYIDGEKCLNKIEENVYNKYLEVSHRNEQKLINKYRVYIETEINDKLNFNNSVDINAQNNELNKFLLDHIGGSPKKYKNGFLYSFDKFEKVDAVLDVLFKVLSSKAPLKYVICLQIEQTDYRNTEKQMAKFIDLRMINKIVIAADTVWRYKHNDERRHSTSQLGVYQYGDDTIEIHQFIKGNV